MRILITGVTGFVGQVLCAQAVQHGLAVSGALRKPGKMPGSIDSVVVGEINGATDWSLALRNVDVVIHLAARVHVMKDTSADPLAEFRKVNVQGTENLARQAARAGVKRLVYVSSVKVNGEASCGEQKFTETDVPAPQDPYGTSKMEAEQALLALSYTTGLEVVIVRPPLVYGPGVRANFLRLMQLVKMGIPLPLGAIHNRRSMVALDNLVDLLIVCAHHPAASGQTFMVSDDSDVSIPELLHMLAGAMGRRSCLLPLPAGIIAGVAALFGKSAVASRLLGSLQVDIAHTKSTLGWKPVVSMQEAVIKTVAHFLVHH